jgi:hypothetical protein
MLGNFNHKYILLCSLILSILLVSHEGFGQKVIGVKKKVDESEKPIEKESNQIKWSINYQFGPKVGISHFTLTTRSSLNQNNTEIVTGMANIFGLSQVISFSSSKRLDLTIDLSLLSSRYSYPSNQTGIQMQQGMFGNAYQAQIGLNIYAPGDEGYFITQVGITHHEIIQQGEIPANNVIAISPSPLAFAAVGLGSRLKKNFLVNAVLAQYLDTLAGLSLSEVSLHYLF